MQKTISIASAEEAGRRAISFDQQPSHRFRETELQQALAEARHNLWKSDAANGKQLGRQLYRQLNGSGGQLDQLLEESLQ